MVRGNQKGIIIKGVGGLYTVMLDDGELVGCGLRGIFRKNEITPLAGDKVVVSFLEDGTARIDEIDERRNKLGRPPVANIDNLIVVVSLKNPRPNYLLIDKMTAISFIYGIKPIIVVSKIDLASPDEIVKIYKSSGFEVFSFNSLEPDYDEKAHFKKLLCGSVSAFSGNSGVGKSSLLNAIYPQLNLNTGEVSLKLGRGRHTTRTTELFPLGEKFSDGFIIDTPGFSSLDFNAVISSEGLEALHLSEFFPEFALHNLGCRFNNCSHLNESGCGVIEALEDGRINESRYESYRILFDDASQLKSWQ